MAGVYTEIMEIATLNNAVSGGTVSVEVKIKNKHSSAIGILVGGALEYGLTPWPGIDFPEYQANVTAGVTHTFQGSFTMPSSDVTIHAYSYWYGSDGYWHLDDEKTRNISLADLGPEFSQFEIADYLAV